MNVLQAIGHVGEDILKGIEWPFVHAAEVAAVIGTALKDEPAVKQAIVQLVQKAESVSPDFVAAIGSSGLNVGADLKAIGDVQSFFLFFKDTFVPAIEAAYKDLKKDVPAAAAPSDPAPSSPAPAAADPQPGPGLHNVVPA